MSDDLERHLRTIGMREEGFPATPALADAVGEMMGAKRPAAVARSAPFRPMGMAALVALAIVAVLAALAVSLALPGTRSAIAGFLGVDGIRIVVDRDGEMPSVPTSIGGSLLLGERSSLEAASAAAPFAVRVPNDAAVGRPDEVHLNQRPGVAVVSLLWPVSDALPEIGETGVGLLLLQIEAEDSVASFVTKSLGADGRLIDTVEIDGAAGYWIEGGVLTVAPVEGLMWQDAVEASRRSGNVLIWSDGEVSYRLESALPMADAARIATSLVPVNVGDP